MTTSETANEAEGTGNVDNLVHKLAGERRVARVKAKDLAKELGIHPTELSKFENEHPRAPEIGAKSYRTAIRRVVEKREAAA